MLEVKAEAAQTLGTVAAMEANVASELSRTAKEISMRCDAGIDKVQVEAARALEATAETQSRRSGEEIREVKGDISEASRALQSEMQAECSRMMRKIDVLELTAETRGKRNGEQVHDCERRLVKV